MTTALQADDGLLAAMPGEFVGKASLTLPDPQMASQETMSVVIEAAWAGTVRIHFRRYRYTHLSRDAWKWSAYRAEKVLDA
jgi:hypothetical protein